ncbi:hypothetical protein [Streptomyces erythrochromogenes]|uniref:hypothetical protein n=1 Tax=Streptomyces erythrochromogenes TaxID=285574 RepID=UPI0037CEA2A5
MTSLLDLHNEGGDIQKAALAFGKLHPRAGLPSQNEPDWTLAGDHWNAILKLFTDTAPMRGVSAAEHRRRAENVARGFLLGLAATVGGRCPRCPRP